MYKLDTKIDLLGELLSYNSENYNKHKSSELYNIVKSALHEIYLNVNDFDRMDKKSALKIFKLMRDYPYNPREVKQFDYDTVLVNVFLVLKQEIKYQLPLSLSYSEISFLLEELEKIEEKEFY